MTEFSDGDFERLLDEANAQQQQSAEAEAFIALQTPRINATLAAAGADRLWLPGDVTQAVLAVDYLTETADPSVGSELARIAAELQVTQRQMDEVFAITMLLNLLVADASSEGRELMIEAEKKRLQARLLVKGFDQGWVQAIDELVSGDSLDLSKEQDLATYVETSYEQISPEPDATSEAVHNIFFAPIADTGDVSRATVAVSASLAMRHLMTRIGRTPTGFAEAEAKVDEFLREGVINQTQAQALHELVAGQIETEE